MQAKMERPAARGWSRRTLLRAGLSTGVSLGCGLTLCGQPVQAAAAAMLPAALTREALRVSRPTQAVLLAVARAGRRLVVAGERGVVIVSDDGGRHWAQASVPVSVTLTALQFDNAHDGWATGNMGVVLRTRDGGSTWQRVLDGQAAAQVALIDAQQQPAGSAPGWSAQDAERLVQDGADKPFMNVLRRSGDETWVLGAFGIAFSSRDGGRQWHAEMANLPNPDGLSYYGGVQRQGECFLFGEQGLLLRCDGAAERYTAQTLPSEGTVFSSLLLGDGTLLLMGLRGKVFRSAARGEPWTLVQTPMEAALFAGTTLDDGRAVLVGSAGQVLVSADGGQRFRPVSLSTRFPFAGVATAPDGALILVGMRGVLRLERAEIDQAQAHPHAPHGPGPHEPKERDGVRVAAQSSTQTSTAGARQP
jgi:photosystem II stability/assembly factor-like uncharacterized protein